MKNYRKRIADDILKRKLEGKGAVLIEGPKWCGKTTTAEQLAASILYMDDPEKKEQNIAMSELSPKRLLKGATPRLIDEWQLAPKLWDAIRFEVDHRGEPGQFVLTGSAVPASINKNSSAANAGMKSGDVITKVDGKKVDDVASLHSILYSHKVGDTVNITINRNGRDVNLKVKLEGN